MKATTILLKKAFVDVENIANKMSLEKREEASLEFEAIALRAGQLAGYFEKRSDFNGHPSGVKALNDNGKKIWTKVFGYSTYINISF